MSVPKKILIVGGGITGLTAALRLAQSGNVSITLVESSSQLGGLAAGFPLAGTSLEKAYHHLFLTDTAILDLVAELGLSEKLMWCDSSVGIFRDGKIHSFKTPMDLMRFSPCSFTGRIRTGLTALYLKRKKDWRGLARQGAHAWMARACGSSAMETIWTPLLKGKFDRYCNSVSMAWLWARIHIRANSRSSGGGGERLGYIRGGFGEIVRRLETELIGRGVQILTDAVVEQFSPTERAARVNGKWMPFDFCVFTGPSPVLAKLLPAEAAFNDYRRQLDSTHYVGAICLVFLSDQDLGDYYWLNVNEPGAPFLVFLNHTKLVDKNFYQNKHVYYIGAYTPTDSAFFSLSDDELKQSWWNYLRKIFPKFDPACIRESHVFRFRAAQHIVDTQYEEKIPDHRTPLPGLFLSNFSQIFPEDRGTNFAVREGINVAELVLKEIRENQSAANE